MRTKSRFMSASCLLVLLWALLQLLGLQQAAGQQRHPPQNAQPSTSEQMAGFWRSDRVLFDQALPEGPQREQTLCEAIPCVNNGGLEIREIILSTRQTQANTGAFTVWHPRPGGWTWVAHRFDSTGRTAVWESTVWGNPRGTATLHSGWEHYHALRQIPIGRQNQHPPNYFLSQATVLFPPSSGLISLRSDWTRVFAGNSQQSEFCRAWAELSSTPRILPAAMTEKEQKRREDRDDAWCRLEQLVAEQEPMEALLKIPEWGFLQQIAPDTMAGDTVSANWILNRQFLNGRTQSSTNPTRHWVMGYDSDKHEFFCLMYPTQHGCLQIKGQRSATGAGIVWEKPPAAKPKPGPAASRNGGRTVQRRQPQLPPLGERAALLAGSATLVLQILAILCFGTQQSRAYAALPLLINLQVTVFTALLIPPSSLQEILGNLLLFQRFMKPANESLLVPWFLLIGGIAVAGIGQWRQRCLQLATTSSRLHAVETKAVETKAVETADEGEEKVFIQPTASSPETDETQNPFLQL